MIFVIHSSVTQTFLEALLTWVHILNSNYMLFSGAMFSFRKREIRKFFTNISITEYIFKTHSSYTFGDSFFSPFPQTPPIIIFILLPLPTQINSISYIKKRNLWLDLSREGKRPPLLSKGQTLTLLIFIVRPSRVPLTLVPGTQTQSW